MFGKKIVVCIISIIMLVLLMSNICNAVSPNPADIYENPETGTATAIDENSNNILGRCIFPLILEIINLVTMVILTLKKKIKKFTGSLVILLNIIMIFVTIIFWNKNYSIWSTILFLNTIIQIAILISIIIYLVVKKTKKEGEKSVKNRK